MADRLAERDRDIQQKERAVQEKEDTIQRLQVSFSHTCTTYCLDKYPAYFWCVNYKSPWAFTREHPIMCTQYFCPCAGSCD